jgi:hypothetical protein
MLFNILQRNLPQHKLYFLDGIILDMIWGPYSKGANVSHGRNVGVIFILTLGILQVGWLDDHTKFHENSLSE